MQENIHEECGVFGIFNHTDSANLTYLGLYALQHRGQESSGIATCDGETIRRHTGMGLVKDIFKDKEIFKRLCGNSSIGHNRYSTAGGSHLANTQPVLIDFKAGQIASAHNGNLTNADELRTELEENGSIFSSTTDTEVIMHLLALSKKPTIDEMILDALSIIKGAFSVLFLTKDALYAARDPYGIRPLALGIIDDSYTVASETCAFDLIGAKKIRSIDPGEMIKITDSGIESMRIPGSDSVKNYAHCVFEHIYFSRPDSTVFGLSVDDVRRGFGRKLAEEHPVEDADFVMGVPDSATIAALGFSEGSGLPYQQGLIRNHYVGRTFILPEQGGRDFGVRIKFNPIKPIIKGKKIVIVDDSVVRGTTMRKIIQLVRSAEPAEVHLRISSPPVTWPCFYGIDMPSRDQFLANNKSMEEIREYFGVDSIGYLTIDGMLDVLPEEERPNYCCACFNGNYPVYIPENTEVPQKKC